MKLSNSILNVNRSHILWYKRTKFKCFPGIWFLKKMKWLYCLEKVCLWHSITEDLIWVKKIVYTMQLKPFLCNLVQILFQRNQVQREIHHNPLHSLGPQTFWLNSNSYFRSWDLRIYALLFNWNVGTVQYRCCKDVVSSSS